MIVPILALQKRARELGRIRIGATKAITKRNGEPGTAPVKLDRFRLTSASRPLLEKVAQLYGGTVAEWTPRGGAQQWEVVTESTRIPILVPPQAVTQWYETWTGGGCVHRCDGETNVLTDEPCDLESEEHQQAKPTTRLNVVLRDVEGIGVWRLESHGWNAAMELPQAAEFLAQAGGYVPGWLSLEERVSRSDGQTRRFIVPTIDIDVTPAQLLAGGGAVQAIAAPAERPALEASRPAIESGQTSATDPLAPYYQALDRATTPDEAMAVYQTAHARLGDLKDIEGGEALYAAIGNRGRELKAAPDTATADPADGKDPWAGGTAVDDEPDPDQVWQQILTRGGELDMGLSDLKADFAEHNAGEDPDGASGAELAAYLELLKQRDAA